jgi:predicted aspartyl protease
MMEGSRLQLLYNTQEDVHEILERYTSAVSLQAAPLFAMATGHFEGLMAGHNVVFMVDTGSELNLMSEGFYR